MTCAKSFEISKHELVRAWKSVKAKKGAAGVDGQSIEKFEEHLKDNLYKIWNRMASGSYSPPPVLRVEIPKGDGGTRPLGIPTVADRVAQMVVVQHLQPILEPIFHRDSFGYRPGKSAKEALHNTRWRCWRYPWVLDLDIKSFFETIDHKRLMELVQRHTDCRWVLMYIERWLKASAQVVDGSLVERTQGTPQGGCVSPLLANLYLHYAFDSWMMQHHCGVPFERYADDIILHCQSEEQALYLKTEIEKRFAEWFLTLHPQKTKIVYCKDDRRKGPYPTVQFDFLGYTFQPRRAKDASGKLFVGFNPAVSRNALKAIWKKIRSWRVHHWTNFTLEDLAKRANPSLRGWVNYYGYYNPSTLSRALYRYDDYLVRWAMAKYKTLRKRQRRARNWLYGVMRQPNSYNSSRTGRRSIATTECWKPYESRDSRTVLREPGGETPPGHSPNTSMMFIPFMKRFTALLCALLAAVCYGSQGKAATPLSPAEAVQLNAQLQRRTEKFDWVPGTHVILYASHAADEASWIYAIDADTGMRAKLLPSDTYFISPDGHQIAYLVLKHVPDGPAPGVWIASLARTATSISVRSTFQLTAFPANGSIESVIWAPDSRHLAYQTSVAEDSSAQTPSPSILWIANLPGDAKSAVTFASYSQPGAIQSASFAWSKNSAHLAYVVNIPKPGVPQFYAQAHGESDTSGDTIRVLARPKFVLSPIRLCVLNIEAGNTICDILDAKGFGIVNQVVGWLDENTVVYAGTRLEPGSRWRDSLDHNGMHVEMRSFSLVSERDTLLLRSTLGGLGGSYNRYISPSGRYIALYADLYGSFNYISVASLTVFDVAHKRLIRLTGIYNAPVQSSRWLPNSDTLVYATGDSKRMRKVFLVEFPGTGVPHATRFHWPWPRLTDASVSSDGRLIAWVERSADWIQSLRVGPSIGTSAKTLLQLDDPRAGMRFGKVMPVTWKSGDGLLLDGYLVYPIDYHPGKRYPLAVILHGGPTAEPNPEAVEWPGGVYFSQIFASRGYMVLFADYRTSENYGVAEVIKAKGKREFLQPDVEDVLGAVNVLEQHGLVDGSRVYLLGHSFGGYIANWAITQTHRFRAVVSYEGGDPYFDWPSQGGWGFYDWWLHGSPWDNLDVYIKNSAVAHVGTVTTPTLFINSGAWGWAINSPAPPWMYAALQARGIDTQFVLYTKEGHMVEEPENQRDLLQRILRWIGEH